MTMRAHTSAIDSFSPLIQSQSQPPHPQSRGPAPMATRSSSLGQPRTSFYDASSAVPPQADMEAMDAAPSGLLHASSSFDAAVTAAEMLRDRSNTWSSNPSASQGPRFPGSDYVMTRDATKKLTHEMAKAVQVVDTFLSPALLKDQVIPCELLTEAHGLVFLTVYKVGFLFSGKIGHGFVIARTAGGWSAPSFISCGGLGFGMMAGGEVVQYMIILSSRGAVKVFTRSGQIQLGSELDLAVGPIGRAASASVSVGSTGIAPNYSYSHSKGLYGGIGLSGAVICTRKSLNAKCYGPTVTARQILAGEVPCLLAVPLWQAIDRALHVERQYANGFPVMQPSASSVACTYCGHRNPMDSETCLKCQRLIVYSVGVHSGKRSIGDLVLRKEMVAPEHSRNLRHTITVTGSVLNPAR